MWGFIQGFWVERFGGVGCRTSHVYTGCLRQGLVKGFGIWLGCCAPEALNHTPCSEPPAFWSTGPEQKLSPKLTSSPLQGPSSGDQRPFGDSMFFGRLCSRSSHIHMPSKPTIYRCEDWTSLYTVPCHKNELRTEVRLRGPVRGCMEIRADR